MKIFVLMLALLAAAVMPLARAKADEASALAGKWHFVLNTEGGDRDMDADFAVMDGKVSGTFGKSEVKGTTSGDNFALEFEVESEEAGKGTLKITGKVGPELTGNWSFQTYDGTFRATRPKTDKPAGQ